jgi:hypothetical protein
MPSEEFDRWLKRLRISLLALALEGEQQIALYPTYVEVADELVLEFDECWHLLKDKAFGDTIAFHQEAALAELDGFIASVSGPTHPDVWTIEALDNREEWTTIRRLATRAADTFGWSNQVPNRLFGSFFKIE